MEYINKLVNLQDYKLNNLVEFWEITLYTIAAFLLPFFIGHPQIIVGVLVNAFLITSALNVRGAKLLAVIVAPVLGALCRGMLFGPFTVFLLYMIPFIWVGNAILVFSFKWLNLERKMNKWVTLIVGSVVKAGFLFGIAYLLVSLNVLPVLFLTTMGLFQLYTAILGGVVAFGIHGVKKKVMA
jgi:hypothetical protein